jgi:hypothetical protein
MRGRLANLLKENDELEKKLAVAVEALEFYAQPRAEFADGKKAFNPEVRSNYEFYPNEDVAIDALKQIKGGGE